MKKIIHNPPTLAAPVGHFDRAIQFGDWLFVSGTSALTNVAGPMADRCLVVGIEAQTREALKNIDLVLASAGGGLTDIYEMRIVLKNSNTYSIVDRVLQEFVPGKGFICHAYEGGLLHPEMEIEIEVKAYLGGIAERTGRSAAT